MYPAFMETEVSLPYLQYAAIGQEPKSQRYRTLFIKIHNNIFIPSMTRSSK
jgi:hypothetical protein